MKLPQKLNSAGALHIVAPLLFIVGVGLVGTYMLFTSHAQTPPRDANAGSDLTCTISGPARVQNRQAPSLHVTVTNDGKGMSQVAYSSVMGAGSNNVGFITQPNSNNHKIPSLRHGHSFSYTASGGKLNAIGSSPSYAKYKAVVGSTGCNPSTVTVHVNKG